MNATVSARTPWHLWVVGLLSLLWNCIGCYDYVMSQTRNAEYMRMITEPYGVDTQAAVAYFDSYPVWADVAWALGACGVRWPARSCSCCATGMPFTPSWCRWQGS